MEKIRVAIIGCGTIANNAHIPAYLKNENVEIAAFCDIIPERAQKAVEDYGCGIAITNYCEILTDESIDAVSICTPNDSHKEISVAAMDAGKHVLCEKPAAKTYEDALVMQKAAHKTGKILNIGVCNRFNSAVNTIKELIDGGALGELYHVYISFRAHRSIPGLGGAFTTKAISGGGVLIDWGVHFLDIVMYCASDPAPKSASAKTFCKLGKDIDSYVFENMWAGPPVKDGIYDVDDFATGFVRTEGPTITFNGAWAQNINESEMFIDFLGTESGIRLQYGGDFHLFGVKDGKLITEKPAFEESNHYENEINSFIQCILTGKKNAAHIDTAVITSKLMQAIYDSSDKGKEIEL